MALVDRTPDFQQAVLQAAQAAGLPPVRRLGTQDD
jgi:hypothetical protein